jgi:hypothetical protein
MSLLTGLNMDVLFFQTDAPNGVRTLKHKKIRIIKFFLSTPWIENTTENSFLILKIMKEALISN